ncbi:adenosine receptor A3-like [Patiria miniata]|uniref:G-protein coupled receptors family 1 profile domain-containing protein n=1 Tax=Patiria miniata TaxID=46514 RepID=A0A914B5B3_PATMI|nr:adenosine receptor A3-like [Patiria miniata]
METNGTDMYAMGPVVHAFMVATIPLCFVSLLIHCYIIFSVIFNRTLHSASNYLLANLCASVVFSNSVSIVTMCLLLHPVALVNITLLQTLNIFCIPIVFVTVFFMSSSAVVAGDRFVKVAHPLRYLGFMTDKTCGCLIGSCWVLSVIVCSCFAAVFVTSEVRTYVPYGTAAYFEATRLNPPYRIFAIFISVIIVLGLLIIDGFVLGLLRIAREQRRKIQNELNMLPNIGANRVRQLGEGSNKTIRYILYLGSYTLAWLPCAIILNALFFSRQIDFGTSTDISMGFILVSLFQLMYGTLFLTFMQEEHRKALQSTWQALVQKLKC